MNDSPQLENGLDAQQERGQPCPPKDCMRNRLSRIKAAFDYLGASRETPPAGFSFLASPLWLGLWWGLLLGLILLFCGQTSKFIYIDF
jgi:hypothetical protein